MVLGPGDDAAILIPPVGQQLVMTQDTSLEGRHFPADMDAADVGYRCLAVNLSDLAAMGADPLWFLLSLTLPDVDDAWLAGFADGLFALADRAGISLVGGDVTRGRCPFPFRPLARCHRGRPCAVMARRLAIASVWVG